MNGHWLCIYRTPKYFIDLYQASIKEKKKGIEMNFFNHKDLVWKDFWTGLI